MRLHRHIPILLALLCLGCLVQVMVIRRATTTALDAVLFARIARSIEQHGLVQTFRYERQQPLFPAWVWAIHQGRIRILGEENPSWAASTQWAAAIPLVLAVVPVYFFATRLVNSAAATAAAFFFCLLPEVSRLGADGISDSTHLLFFCLALWAMVEALQGAGWIDGSPELHGGAAGGPAARRWRTPFWLLLAGAATAAAVLTRAESLVLVAALGITPIMLLLRPQKPRPWQHLSIAAVGFCVGFALVMGPYLAAVRSLNPQAVVRRILGHYQEKDASSHANADDVTGWLLEDGEAMSFDATEPTVDIRRRGYLSALGQFGEALADASGYWIGVLMLLGLWLRRRGGWCAADRLLQVFSLLFAAAVVHFTAREGYLEPRHLLGIVVAGLPSAGYGGLWLGALVSRGWVSSSGRWVGSSRVAWTAIVLLGSCCLPQTLTRHHHSRLGHREAARWLTAQPASPGIVLDTHGWTGLYSGRETYTYEAVRKALGDPRLEYLVVEQQELTYASDRSRTLRSLIATAAELAAVFPRPAGRRPDQQEVAVYRWNADRFRLCETMRCDASR